MPQSNKAKAFIFSVKLRQTCLCTTIKNFHWGLQTACNGLCLGKVSFACKQVITSCLLAQSIVIYIFNPNRSLDRLPIILGFFHRFLFIFRLLVGILPALFSRRSPLRLQGQDRQYAQQYTKSAQALATDLGLSTTRSLRFLCVACQ